MRKTLDSDPKLVEVRNKYGSAERLRKRLTEESSRRTHERIITRTNNRTTYKSK